MEHDRLPCPRCSDEVKPIRPWPHWRKARIFYFCVLASALPAGPWILADGFFMIPMLMIVMAAIGPLNHLARQRPVCSRCSAVLA
ncbi:MAG: hypothetical protein OXT09_10235 [Myxococcales bacterium]|nr:hypothetical protein [Myxococcales bacterium]